MGCRIRRRRGRGSATPVFVVLVALFLLTAPCETSAAASGAPRAPSGPSAVPGNARATVRWTAPANNGFGITGYVITAYIGVTVQSSRFFRDAATTEIVTGL